jgi:hypothetical protein
LAPAICFRVVVEGIWIHAAVIEIDTATVVSVNSQVVVEFTRMMAAIHKRNAQITHVLV